MALTVALVEDNTAVRTSMLEILRDAANCQCVGAFASAERALQEIPKLKPRVVLMDIELKKMNGVECVRHLAQLMELPQIIMLTVHEDPESIFQSLAAGAAGYLLKPVRAAELLAAIEDVQAGGAPMTSSIARKVVQSFKGFSAAPAAIAKPAHENLSPREIEVLDLLVQGYSYKEVAAALNVAYSTVHTHIERIYKKLYVQSRAQAVARYLKV